MKFPAIAALILGLAWVATPSQSQTVANFYYYRIQPGATEKFEAGYRQHLGWHRDHHDPLPWFGWMIEGGEHNGQFVDATLGVHFAALDKRVDVAGDGANFRNMVSPFVTPQPGAMFVLLKDLSTATPLEDRKPASTMQVTRFHVRPGHEAQFESAMAVAREKLAAMRLAPAHTCYRIVVGGTQTEYLLMVSRANLASYDDFRADLDMLLSGNKALHDFADAVEGATSETWTYRPDLSNLP
jgi:heme-degrading monooxygenase HmoA